MVNNLVQTKNELLKHRDMLQGQVAQLTSQNQTLSAKVDVLTTERETEGHELHTLKEQLVARKAELERELRKKEKLDQDLKESRAQLDARAEDIKTRQGEIAKKEEALRKVNSKLRDET